MASRIQGITVEIGGDTTKLSKALESVNKSMEYMAMAGWKTSDMLNGIEGIMNLAAASGEDLATTSDIVTDEAKLEQMAERGSVGRASISDQLKAGKAAAEQAKAERPPNEKPSRSAER